MNQTLSTFLKIGITALCIGLLLFGVGYTMVKDESDEFETTIRAQHDSLPTD